MTRSARLILAAAAFASGAVAQITGTTTIYIRGKVVMEDGSPLPKRASIARLCVGSMSSTYAAATTVAFTDKDGQFTWRMDIDTTDPARCDIWAEMVPYKSSRYTIPDMNQFSDPHLPALVLSQNAPSAEEPVFAENAKVPAGAQVGWKRALASSKAGKWADADRALHMAVEAAPTFARGWYALGVVLEAENKPSDAAPAFRSAINADPKMLIAYVPLARLNIEIMDWDGAAEVTGELIKRDSEGHFPEARLIQSMARYYKKDYDGAIASATEVLRMDTQHKFPSAEYVMGISLGSKKDYDPAREHLNRYLQLAPHTPNAQAVKTMIADLGKAEIAPPPPPGAMLTTELPSVGVPGEAWVPGGRKALAKIARLKDESTFDGFFSDYCAMLAREMTVGTSQGIPQYLDTIRAYMASVTELLTLGERKGDITTVTMSLANDSQRKSTEKALALLGWKLVPKDGAFLVEPGDQAADGPRQQIPKAFGIDEVAMQETLEAGKSFQFEIPTENARVVGGNDWSTIWKELPSIPGGIAAAFTLDVRVAKTYAGLGAMSPDAASAVIRAVGVRNLVLRDSDVMARYGDAFEVAADGSTQIAVVPGGAGAEAVWKKLSGVSPREAAPFFRALVDKNEGRLAAFYFAMWGADKAHQDYYLTKTEARAERFYTWYRDSDEFKLGIGRHAGGWRTELLQKLPLDAEGNVRYPGGKHAWTTSAAPDEEAITGLKNLEALIPMVQLEEKRKSPLDEASATILAQHYSEWRSLFPYFEKLPSLGSQEFAALQSFAANVNAKPPATQNIVLGEWYSLVELIARGYQAGSLDAAQSARAFRSTCDGLSQDRHTANAMATLREIAGPGNLSEAVPANLLRLNPEQRRAFERVLELQSVPRFDAGAGNQDTPEAAVVLSGYVYAASVDPDSLLLSEDPQLLSRHQFTTPEPGDKRPFEFQPASLVGSNTPPGSYLKGGFVNINEVARALAPGGRSVPPITVKALAKNDSSPLLAAAETLPNAPEVPEEVIFHSNSRLVEEWAIVTDSRGRYVDDLPQEQFTLLDGQQPQPVVSFEANTAPVSVVLLLDTTGSMSGALPAVKNAALKMIGDLRPIDSVAVYSFNRSATELQSFTSDLSLAKRAVLNTHAEGETSLYDALARVSRDLSGRTGKKVIVVFTDGDDNSSTLTMDTSILRVKVTGVPVYTIAQGSAVEGTCHTREECRVPGPPPAYVRQLADLAKVTGGESFAIRDPNEIAGVFEKISEDLAHGYLLVFQAPHSEDHVWHPIAVQIRGTRTDKVRAREGYYPE